MPLHVLSHPLAAHIITHLRDQTTKPATFRTLAYQISLLLAIEATADIPTEPKEIETPLEPLTGRVLAHQPLVVIPILRAGLGMVQPFTDIFPDVSVGYLGLERDHATAVARNYYCKLPPLTGRRVFIVDPMLATGGSAAQAIAVAKEKGAVAPTLVCIVSSPEGAAEVERQHPGTVIHTAAHDRALNAKKYILPGLGDFGDRLYGT
ncbi:MAG: Uracil phosphoribosyltransferase [Verrucomicrobiota bacterium]|jgi:uracil phosphoribosyltransferase